MSDGIKKPHHVKQSFDLFDKHVDFVRDATSSDDVAAIGSDLDGFIKPSLPGFERPSVFVAL
jgi:hypothetical protein